MMIRNLLIPASIFTFISLFSCTSDYKNAESTINEEDMIEIVKEFASDEFHGRKPFTEGEEKTVDYLVREYKRIGLEPVNNGSYIQEVPMVEVTNVPDERMKINFWNASIELKYKDDFVAFSKRLTENIKIRYSRMVFTGRG